MLKQAQQRHQLELNTISEAKRTNFEIKAFQIKAMGSSDKSLRNEIDEQLTPNHIDAVERGTDWENNADPNNTMSVAVETVPQMNHDF